MAEISEVVHNDPKDSSDYMKTRLKSTHEGLNLLLYAEPPRKGNIAVHIVLGYVWFKFVTRIQNNLSPVYAEILLT